MATSPFQRAGVRSPLVWFKCWIPLLVILVWPSMAQAGTAVRHRLLEGSLFIDDCPPCGRPTIPLRLRGTFDLERIEENPLFARYALQNIDWTTADYGGGIVRITGTGLLKIGGEVALTQELRLDVTVAMVGTNIARHFTNELVGVTRPWPNLAVDLIAEEQTFTQLFHLSIRSIPLRELWFVTANGFTPGIGGLPIGNYRPAGDVLSLDGRVVVENERMTSRLGLMPVVPPLAVDAFDVLPGGIPVFSLRDPVFSETLGDLPSGTLLTAEGKVYRRAGELLEPFHPVPVPVTDPGVDAVQVMDDGEVIFSTNISVPVEGGVLDHGDVLGSQGRVVRRFKDLVAAFEPQFVPGAADAGVDALHVWPHGEIWFSVAQEFNSATVGSVRQGDIVSDGGWVVYRNLELLEGFQPLEDLADFGLTGLFLVTDAGTHPEGAVLTPPQVGEDVLLEWKGPGRVFQVEFSPAWELPFQPNSPVLPDRVWSVGKPGNEGWYRVRSW